MSDQAPRRRLAAILAADVVGYSRLMERDEAGTLAALKKRRKEVLEPLVAKHSGRVFKLVGDGVLVEFTSAVNAVQCAIDLQHAMAAANTGQPEDHHIVLRIGVNLGDVMVEGSDLYGDGVNVAARLEAIADPGGILISSTTQDYVRNKVKAGLEDLGPQNLKNIAEPVRTYRITDMPAVPLAASRAATERPSIAVLPFLNMSGDTGQQYFSDGITEDIITELSRFRELLVIARNSSFQYRGTAQDIRRIGRELGADYVVEGSVRKAGDLVRITAQLIDAATNSHLWAERYDRGLTDTFEILDEVTRTIVTSLIGRLVESNPARVARKSASQWSAYDLLLQARARLSNFDYGEAELLVRRAIELDPKLALAHALAAWIYLQKFFDSCDERMVAEALPEAKRALDLDNNDGWCHSIVGTAYLFKGQFDPALSHLKRAVDLNPNNTHALQLYAVALTRTRQSDKAIQILEAVERSDPFLDAHYWSCRAQLLLQKRRYEEVISALDHMTQKPMWAHGYLAVAHANIGEEREARHQIAEVRRLQPDMTISKFMTSEPWQDTADAKRIADGLHKAGLPE